jgi:hypothetical protein
MKSGDLLDVWRGAWNKPDHVSSCKHFPASSEIANAISSAELRLRKLSGFPMVPTWKELGGG